MRYYLPDIFLAEELPHQAGPQDKLGGLPWGLRASMWPVCSDCGKYQTLLAQFVHHPERLDLGREGRILNVFQCNHDPGMCSTWEGGSGANACFITEPEELLAGPSSAPSDEPLIEREVRVEEWITRDDGISIARVPMFFSDEEFMKLPEAEIMQVTTGTRLGGVPSWIQSPDEALKDGWRFVGQLDSAYSFLRAPGIKSSGVNEDGEHWEGRSHYCEGPNFGDGGIAYLFVRGASTNPEDSLQDLLYGGYKANGVGVNVGVFSIAVAGDFIYIQWVGISIWESLAPPFQIYTLQNPLST